MAAPVLLLVCQRLLKDKNYQKKKITKEKKKERKEKKNLKSRCHTEQRLRIIICTFFIIQEREC